MPRFRGYGRRRRTSFRRRGRAGRPSRPMRIGYRF